MACEGEDASEPDTVPNDMADSPAEAADGLQQDVGKAEAEASEAEAKADVDDSASEGEAKADSPKDVGRPEAAASEAEAKADVDDSASEGKARADSPKDAGKPEPDAKADSASDAGKPELDAKGDSASDAGEPEPDAKVGSASDAKDAGNPDADAAVDSASEAKADLPEEVDAPVPDAEMEASADSPRDQDVDVPVLDAAADAPSEAKVDSPQDSPDAAADAPSEAKVDSPQDVGAPVPDDGVNSPREAKDDPPEEEPEERHANKVPVPEAKKWAYSASEDVHVNIVVDGDEQSASWLKLRHGETFTVGRFPQLPLVIEHRGISNKHCELKLGTDGSGAPALSIKDLSSNGTGLQPPDASGTSVLQKGVDTPVPNGSIVLLPMSLKAKRGDDASQARRFFSVRFGEPPAGIAGREVAVDVKVAVRSPAKVPELPPIVPERTPEPPRQLPAVDALIGAAASDDVHSGTVSPPASPAKAAPRVRSPEKISPAAAPAVPLVKFSIPCARPKGLPKKPREAPVATAREKGDEAAGTAAEAPVESSPQKVSRKALPQKSRSRDRSASRSRSASKSRGRGRGRGRKRSPSNSESRSRSPSRKRKRKRKKSRSRKKKRRRSKSNSSRSRSRDDEKPGATGPPGAANPMANMQGMQQWQNMQGMYGQASPYAGYGNMQGMQSSQYAGYGNMQQGSHMGGAQMSVEMVKQQIYYMYQRFKPEKLPEIETILKKYKGSEYELLQAMMTKYLGGVAAGGGTAANGQQ